MGSLRKQKNPDKVELHKIELNSDDTLNVYFKLPKPIFNNCDHRIINFEINSYVRTDKISSKNKIYKLIGIPKNTIIEVYIVDVKVSGAFLKYSEKSKILCIKAELKQIKKPNRIVIKEFYPILQ